MRTQAKKHGLWSGESFPFDALLLANTKPSITQGVSVWITNEH